MKFSVLNITFLIIIYLFGNYYFNNITWDEILYVSNEQELIDKHILFQTIKFMLKETEEDDPKLIITEKDDEYEPLHF